MFCNDHACTTSGSRMTLVSVYACIAHTNKAHNMNNCMYKGDKIESNTQCKLLNRIVLTYLVYSIVIPS